MASAVRRTAVKRGRSRPVEAAAPEDPCISPEEPSAADDFFTRYLGVSRVEFFRTYFEKQPRFHRCGSAAVFAAGHPAGGIPPVDWSTRRMKELVARGDMHYGRDLDVVRLDPVLGERRPYKTEGVVTEAELQRCMQEGWSVRFLRPQEHVACNSAFIALLEDLFACYGGANSYWTPADRQGFAPHYDDVDVFLLQLEGEKEWRLYAPLEDVDHLARHSSEDYAANQLGAPRTTHRLQPGDVLYMPRGTIHQGRTPAHTHSLHITFSANQMNTWADWVLRAAEHSVETCAANDVAWRHALPRNLGRVLGAAHAPAFRRTCGLPDATEAWTRQRTRFQHRLREFITTLTTLLMDEAHMDLCADVYAKETIRRRQPGGRWAPAKPSALRPGHPVRLISRDCCRLMLHVPGEARVYHSGTNAPVCLQAPLGELRFEDDFAPAIATLIARFPKGTAVTALPFPGFDDPEDVAENQRVLVEALHDAKILVEA